MNVLPFSQESGLHGASRNQCVSRGSAFPNNPAHTPTLSGARTVRAVSMRSMVRTVSRNSQSQSPRQLASVSVFFHHHHHHLTSILFLIHFAFLAILNARSLHELLSSSASFEFLSSSYYPCNRAPSSFCVLLGAFELFAIQSRRRFCYLTCLWLCVALYLRRSRIRHLCLTVCMLILVVYILYINEKKKMWKVLSIYINAPRSPVLHDLDMCSYTSNRRP
jgi:hypothetical protein